MKLRATFCGALGLVVLLAGCAGQHVGQPLAWYGAHGGTPPSGDRIFVCHAFGCAIRTPVTVGAADRAAVARIMRTGAGSAAAERKAIAEAISWFERRVAKTVGSAGDVGGLDLANAGVPGQMDCIDEATNTTSYLLLLQGWGQLRHHHVASPVARGFFLDGRYPHATAVVVDEATRKPWAVDSWPNANGVKPDVMTLQRWFASYPWRSD
jgi:hypothetical protein